jgi:hypothetical protein
MKSRKAVFEVEIDSANNRQFTREMRIRIKGSDKLFPDLITEMQWHWDYLCPRAPLKTTLKVPNKTGRVYEIYN